MKKAGILAASLAATALAAAAPDHHATNSPSLSSEKGLKKDAGTGSRRGVENKFAPRFDGLRFIETLVTAHR